MQNRGDVSIAQDSSTRSYRGSVRKPFLKSRHIRLQLSAILTRLEFTGPPDFISWAIIALRTSTTVFRSYCLAVVFLHGFTGARDDTWDRFPGLLGSSTPTWDIFTVVLPGDDHQIVDAKAHYRRYLPEFELLFFDARTHPLGSPTLQVEAVQRRRAQAYALPPVTSSVHGCRWLA